MEPTETINLLEARLRQLVEMQMKEKWKQHEGVDLNKLEAKRTADKGVRRGCFVVNDLIDYLEFRQLKDIILDNWSLFAPALPKQEPAKVYLNRLEGLRNVAMHSRDLMPFEKALIEGMAGELGNLLSIYRSTLSKDNMSYYPTIDSVADNFNRAVSPPPSEQNPAGPGDVIRVQIGDIITFRCLGHDPQGEPLTWKPWVSGATPDVLTPLVGEDVTVEWTVTEKSVGEFAVVFIPLIGARPFHRWNHHDGQVAFPFAVDPPK